MTDSSKPEDQNTQIIAKEETNSVKVKVTNLLAGDGATAWHKDSVSNAIETQKQNISEQSINQVKNQVAEYKKQFVLQMLLNRFQNLIIITVIFAIIVATALLLAFSVCDVTFNLPIAAGNAIENTRMIVSSLQTPQPIILFSFLTFLMAFAEARGLVA